MTRELHRLETGTMVFQETGSDDDGYAIVNVLTKKPGEEQAGTIRWYGPRHQYVYMPTPALSLYTGRQLCDIYDVLGRMMNVLHERKLRSRRAPTKK